MKRRAGQEGMTFVELLMATAIGGVIMAATVPLIFQLLQGPPIINSSLTATHQVREAARWISKDAMSASDTNLVDGAPPTGSVTLTWIEWVQEGPVNHTVSYYLSGTDLKRNSDGNLTTVARGISDIQFSRADVVWPDFSTHRVITVTIRCAPDGVAGRSEQKTFVAYLRPSL